jgi:signal transduction histidine kinase
MTDTSQITLTEALIEVSHTICSGTGLMAILATVKDVAVRLINAERASVFVFDRAGRRIWTLPADGTNMIMAPEGKGIAGEVVRNNTVLNIPDVTSDDRFCGDMDRQTGFVTRNILCAPMCNRQGSAFGAIEILNKRGGAFTEDDERMLNVFGTQAGLAIEHVEMYEDLQQNLEQSRLLCSIQDNINAGMDLHQIFGRILSKLVSFLGGIDGIIHIVIGNKETYYGYNFSDGLVSWESDEVRQCPAFLGSLIAAVSRVSDEQRTKNCFCLSDLVCVDLLRGDKRPGYMAVRLDPDESRLFNERPVDCLKIIAAQTVSFLDKKQSLEEKKRSGNRALLGSVLSMVVHDMKNPLCGASGFAQLIKQKAGDETIRSYGSNILVALERIDRMNNELLMYVRGDTVYPDNTEISLRQLFGQLISDSFAGFSAVGITVTIRCEPDEDINIVADRDRLLKVFGNIISNACEAMPKGGNIDISLVRAGAFVRIRISDTGTGIPAFVKQNVFEPFVTHGKKNGIGLGMTIARTVVESQGGTIGVESTLGKGTVFTIHLPSAEIQECLH